MLYLASILIIIIMKDFCGEYTRAYHRKNPSMWEIIHIHGNSRVIFYTREYHRENTWAWNWVGGGGGENVIVFCTVVPIVAQWFKTPPYDLEVRVQFQPDARFLKKF